jgi:hypothetical protein
MAPPGGSTEPLPALDRRSTGAQPAWPKLSGDRCIRHGGTGNPKALADQTAIRPTTPKGNRNDVVVRRIRHAKWMSRVVDDAWRGNGLLGASRRCGESPSTGGEIGLRCLLGWWLGLVR